MKNKFQSMFKFLRSKCTKEEIGAEYHLFGPSGPRDYVVTALCAIFVFVAYYRYAFTIMITEAGTDLNFHAEFAVEFYMKWENFKKAWIRVPYMLWHLIVKFLDSKMDFPISDAVAMTYALFGVFTMSVMTYFIYCVVKDVVGNCTLRASALASLALSFVGPYSKWWFTPYSRYLGQFSPNPYHNPTHMAVKGIGMIVAMMGIDIIKSLKGEHTIFVKSDKLMYLWFGIALFFSTLAKPTFMYMLLPAGALYLVGYLIYCLIVRNKKAVEALFCILKITVASVPSLGLLIMEYLAFYAWGNQYPSEVVISKMFEVWHMFTNDVPTSVMLAMCFVIWMIITNPGFFLKTTEGLLSLLCYVVGTLEFSFIAEAGMKASSANFAWCMMAGMTVIYTTSVAKLIANTMQKKKDVWHIGYIMFSWVLFFMHVYSGYDYLLETVGSLF